MTPRSDSNNVSKILKTREKPGLLAAVLSERGIELKCSCAG
jgi:hypothetical protein